MLHALRRALCGVSFGLGLVLTFGISTAARADAPLGSGWVSSDTVIYLEAPRPSALLDRLMSASYQDVLSAIPQYQEFRKSDGLKTARTIIDVIAGKLDTTWEKALPQLVGGGVVFAVEAEHGKAPRVFLIVSPTDTALLERANQTVLELARADATANGRSDPVKTAEHHGITMYSPDKGVYAIVKGNLVIADSPDHLKTIIDRALDDTKATPRLADSSDWQARRAQVGSETMAWGLARLDRLRAIDPKKFAMDGKPNPPLTFLLGSWIKALKEAPWVSLKLDWTESRLGADLTLPAPKNGYGTALKGFIPPAGAGAPGLIRPPGTIASVSLWRNLEEIWDARTDLFPPEVVQNLAKLDGFAGQFFGGRDFGSGVIGSLATNWRLVVARQDEALLKPVPDVKLPAFALVVDLKPDDDFAQRLKVAFQSFVGLSNLNAAQTKAPPLELGSETVDDITISTARYMPPKSLSTEKEPVHRRHNFSPSVAQVENHFILSSSVGLTRDLVKALRSPAKAESATFVVDASGTEVASLIDANRSQLVMRDMLDKGHNKQQAEQQVETLGRLLHALGHAHLSVQDNAEVVRLNLDVKIGK